MGYILTRDGNSFTVLKTGEGDLYVTVYAQSNCQLDEYEVVIAEQEVLVSTSITLPNKDSLYRIQFTDSDGLDESTYVSVYKEFLKSLIEDIKYVLCGCACESCPDCGKKEKDYLSALVKMFSYNIINGSMYNQFFTATGECVKCNILDVNQCLLRNETILGNSDNTELMKQVIAYYYLVYYYTDLRLNQNSSNVTTLYDYKNIIKCIKKLGIDESCINGSIVIEEPEGIFTVEFNNTFV